MAKHRRWCVTAVTATVLVVVTSCTMDNPQYQGGPDLPEECRAGSEVSETFEQFEHPRKVDLWMVVDNAEGGGDYQDALADSMSVLQRQVDGEEVDVRAAVSTMDPEAGVDLAPVIGGPEGCENNTDSVAESSDDDWADTLACNVRQGTEGERRRQPMEMIRNTLQQRPDRFDNFRRDDARLVTVVFSNMDDCSGDDFQDDEDSPIRSVCAWQHDRLSDIDEWVDELQGSAVVREGISLVVMSGPPSGITYEEGEDVRHSCQSAHGRAFPAERLHDASRSLGEQGRFDSICTFRFDRHMEALAQQEILNDQVTLCPSETMAHEPLEVVGVGADGESEDIAFGPGFEFVGATDDCEQGAIRLRGEGAEGVERVEMRYCGL